jgi:hypothetical protein
MWGAWALSVLPASLFYGWVASTENIDVLTRNALLIPIGAVLGGCLFAYAGYLIHDIRVARAKPAPNIPTANTLDQTILAECYWSHPPSVVPPYGLYGSS